MRFVIWGVGNLGKLLLDILTDERIVAFIDCDSKLQDKLYQGIPIINYDTYKQNYIQYPIIVSPLYSEQEIISLLYRDNIKWAFSFSKSIYEIEGFLRQAPLTYLMKDYRKDEKIYVYGFSALGIIMYDYLCKNDYQCRIIFQSSIEGEIKKNIERNMRISTGSIDEVSAGERILLAKRIEKSDKLELKKEVIVESYYDIGTKEKLYYNPQIIKFRDIHLGERCFIVATGPSLKVEDLNILHKKQEICFSVNGIFKIFENTKWRPDYYILCDPKGMLLWEKDILEMNVKAKFISDVAWKFNDDRMPDNIYKWHQQNEWEDGKEPKFSDDFATKSYIGYTIVYDGALQLAVYMGFREIYLLGTDCTNSSGKNHFINNYSQGETHLNLENMMLAYKAAKKYADSHGIKIYNATRGGNLEVFERVDFDSLF